MIRRSYTCQSCGLVFEADETDDDAEAWPTPAASRRPAILDDVCDACFGQYSRGRKALVRVVNGVTYCIRHGTPIEPESACGLCLSESGTV